ncbi:DLW-39 family protein [Antrihabitans cavernicola]|nr:DLW-39 family protein [Spelaeibacter cavernicola]
MKILLPLGVVVAAVLGFTKLKSQRNGEDVWHEATRH